MLAEEALELVEKLLVTKQINEAEKLVFLQSWAGKRYQEISLKSGYDEDYIKLVGAQLWNYLSEPLGKRVTKKNFRRIIENFYRDEYRTRPNYLQSKTSSSQIIKFPGGLVPLHSNLYISRSPLEEDAFLEAAKPGSLLRIIAPRMMGKTSLVYRILNHARETGLYTATLNFQQADSTIFTDLNRFLRWFSFYVSRQLNLEPRLDGYWNEMLGSKVSCTVYFKEYLLEHLDRPVVLALDEVNRIFEYPDLAQNFLPLLRVWYEAAAELEVWQKLRWVIVYNTEIDPPLKPNQFPFNIGLPLELPEFNLEQVRELAQRYGLNEMRITLQDLDRLVALVGGHPYLLQLAFYWLRQQKLTLEQLLEEAPTQTGIYIDHLRQHWQLLRSHPKLWTAFQQVLAEPEGVQLEAIAAHRLKSMGLVKLQGNQVTPRCELYRLYFTSQLINADS